MKSLRFFVLALLVLVLPLQAVAREQLRGCGGHRGMAAAQVNAPAQALQMQHHGHQMGQEQQAPSGEANASTCQVCSPCCLGAALLPVYTSPSAFTGAPCFFSGAAQFFVSIDLSSLDPPPKA
jgi:hypothetical protein